MTPLENFCDIMPPQLSVAAPASQPIGNVIAAAPTCKIKLPPFKEEMPQAWFIQAEAFFCCNGLDALVLRRAMGTDASAEEVGPGHTINPGPAPQSVQDAKGTATAPVQQGREGLLQEAAQHAARRSC